MQYLQMALRFTDGIKILRSNKICSNLCSIQWCVLKVSFIKVAKIIWQDKVALYHIFSFINVIVYLTDIPREH